MAGTPQRPNPEKAELHIPTRIAPKPGEPRDGAAHGDVVPGDESEIPDAPEIPDPMSRRMPITYKEIENMVIQRVAQDARQRKEEKSREGDIQRSAGGG